MRYLQVHTQSLWFSSPYTWENPLRHKLLRATKTTTSTSHRQLVLVLLVRRRGLLPTTPSPVPGETFQLHLSLHCRCTTPCHNRLVTVVSRVAIAAGCVYVGRGRCRPPSTWHVSFTVSILLLPGLHSCFHLLCVVHPTSDTSYQGLPKRIQETNDCMCFSRHLIASPKDNPVAASWRIHDNWVLAGRN